LLKETEKKKLESLIVTALFNFTLLAVMMHCNNMIDPCSGWECHSIYYSWRSMQG